MNIDLEKKTSTKVGVFLFPEQAVPQRMCRKLIGKRITDRMVANQYPRWLRAGDSEKKLVKSFHKTLTR